ncbi:diguanylate cyclase [Deinococcus altitudinis]|uniref:GGDEF domain-containing protein n=1 Tax=Deinococcus altitudinis TaxID=468914 RepID=UPI00389206E2
MEQPTVSQPSLIVHLLALEQAMTAERGPPEAGWVERRLDAVLAALDVGQPGQAMGYALRALELSTELNDFALQSRSHVSVALIYSDSYDLASAEHHFALARTLALTPPDASTPPDPGVLARVIINLAHHLLHGRAYSEAYHELMAEAGLFASLDESALLVVYHVNLVAACVQLYRQGTEPVSQWQRQVEESVRLLEQLPQQALTVTQRLDILDSLTQAALLRDEGEEALHFTQRRIELARQADSPLLLGSAYRQLGQVWQARQNWPAAVAAFSEALRLYGEGQQRVPEMELREELAAAHASSGDYRAAYLVQRGSGQSGLLMEQLLRQRAQIGAALRQALESDWQASTYREASEQDFLTGIANRARAVSILEVLQQGLDSGEVKQVAIAILDIDHFKQVNDRHGHEVGDQVLIAVARYADEAVRDQDQVARYGGEEFLLILRETSLEEAQQACERLRVGLERLDFPEWPGLKVTASFGVSTMQPGLTVRDALRMADAQMYLSKHTGRNRVNGQASSSGGPAGLFPAGLALSARPRAEEGGGAEKTAATEGAEALPEQGSAAPVPPDTQDSDRNPE